MSFILDAYSNRLADACSVEVAKFKLDSEKELLGALDEFGYPIGVNVPSGSAHRLGIIHRTADVIVANVSRCVLLQQRGKDDPMFPSYFTLSAGGHCVRGEEPLVAARRELEEELGIYVSDLSRFVRIHNYDVGVPNFYREWNIGYGMERCWQFSPRGLCYFSELANVGHYTVFWPNDWVGWRALLSSRRSSDAQLIYLNQEFCFYYMIKLTDQELDFIFSKGTKVDQIKVVPIKELVDIAGNPFKATDSIWSLQQFGYIQSIVDML